MANKTQFSGARASLERWLKRLVQSTSMLLMLAVGTLVHAETRTEVGVAGAHGVDAQATASVAGDGEGGEGATVDLSSPPLGNEALYDSTAIGGRGGNGGRGHTRADGGHGGPGGAASARSAINRDSGPATARASAIGGDGGHFGNGGTSGTGGPGGSATASGVASTASADAIVVEVTARGGRSGDTSTGIPVEGGTATITEARAESNGGDVEVDATAISGRGGSGFPNSNGLFVGPGGRSPDVVLRNVVDGMTSGTIVLRQTAVSGDGGGGFSQPALGISAPDSGDTVSFVERMRSATSLSIEATAQSGAGGQGTYASTGGRGGNADAHASADNPIGAAAATSSAVGGQGGDVAPLFGLLVSSPVPLAAGGHATAYSRARGLTGTSRARANANAGSAGSNVTGTPTTAPVIGGIGGDATATAEAIDAGSTGHAEARAEARAGGAGVDNLIGTGRARKARAGAAEATAIARSTQRAVATAFASTTAAPARNGASARVIAEAPISQTTVIAQAGGTDTDRVRTQVARLGIAGPLSALAGAGRDPDGTNLLGLDLATVASIAPTDALTGSGDTLLQLSLLFDSSGVGSGPLTYTSDVQFDLLFSPGQSRSIAYTLGEIDAFGAGIQSFVLEIRIENGLGQTIRSNSQQDLEMLFDGQELALGRFSNDPLNPLDIDFHFAVTLGTPGDGIITGASLLAPVPLPAPLAMMVMALLVAAPALGRPGSTSTCQPSTAPKRRRPAP